MDLVQFRASLALPEPPAGLTPPLVALWHLGRDQWSAAHAAVQDDERDPQCAWVHAHLHRVEGDPSNARYWYRRAGRPESRVDLPQEWEEIVSALLEPGSD